MFKFFHGIANLRFFVRESERITNNSRQTKEKVNFSETLKSKIFVDRTFSWIEVHFDRKTDQLRRNAFDQFRPRSAKRTITDQNGPSLINLDPSRPKRPAIGQFRPWLTKTVRDWPIWTLNDQNGPSLVNLDSEWPKRTVIGQFGTLPIKTARV